MDTAKRLNTLVCVEEAFGNRPRFILTLFAILDGLIPRDFSLIFSTDRCSIPSGIATIIFAAGGVLSFFVDKGSRLSPVAGDPSCKHEVRMHQLYAIFLASRIRLG